MCSSTQENKGFYGWITLAGASLVFFFAAGVVWLPFGVFLPYICAEFGWSRGAVSGAAAMSVTIAGLCGPFAGWLVGKYGAKRVLAAGSLLSASGLLLLSFHSHIWQFYVGYGLLIGLGIGIGTLIPATTLANDWFDRKRPLALAIVMASGGLGPLIMIPVIMALIGAVGWRSTYWILFAIVLVFMVLVPGIIVRNKPEELGQVPDGSAASGLGIPAPGSVGPKHYQTPVDFTAGEAIRTASFWLLTVFGFTQFFAFNMLAAHQVAYLMDMGIAAGIAATALGLIPGMIMVAQLGAGILGMRFNMRTLALGAAALMAASMALMMGAKALPLIFSSIILFGLGFGVTAVSLLNFFPIYFGRKNYPKILGIHIPFMKILGGLGAPIAGAVFDATGSYRIPFLTGIILLLGGLICLLLATPPLHPSRREECLKSS